MGRVFRSFAIAAVVLGFLANIEFAQAKLFSNQFVEFQLPASWRCQLDGSEWVCQNTNEEKKRDAIIVLAAKIKKAGMDELPVYESHLKGAQVYVSPSGQKVISKPRYVKRVNLSGKTWIDSLHLDSEIPDFFTRYLATVEADLGILLTFSVRKDKYQEYSVDIDALVSSLKAFRRPGDINATSEELDTITPDVAVPDKAFPDVCPKGQRMNKKGVCQKRKKSSGSEEEDMMPLLLLIIVIAGAGYYIYSKKKRS